MRNPTVLVALALVAAFASEARAQTTMDDGFAGRLSEHIRVLSGDDFLGRAPRTDGERLTLDYLRTRYTALGLQPGGPDGAWTQSVTLAWFTPESRSAEWSGPSGTRTLAPGPDILLRALVSGEADLQAVPVVFAGYGVVAPERGWDDYAGIDVRGKLVLVTEGEPAFPPLGDTINTMYNTARYKEAEALRRGAAGVLLVIPASRTDPMWVNRAAYQTIRLNVMARDAGLPVTGQINRDEVADMMAAAGLDPVAVFDGATRSGFEARELAGVRFSAAVKEQRETRTTSNFLARLPGRERPDETILLLAHWDHLGRARAPDAAGDDIFNGAWDNASGTGALIELARELSQAEPLERSVVFLHTTSEEAGLLGSQWYGEHPVYPVETTVAALNVDMLPLTPRTRDLAVVGLGRTTLEDDLAALASAQGRHLTGEGDPGQGLYQRTDHFSLAERGVPALHVKGGVDLVEGGEAVGRPLMEGLLNAYYHSRDDEWRDDYVFDAAAENLALYRDLIRSLGNSDQWPEWKAAAEFGARRRETAAARAER